MEKFTTSLLGLLAAGLVCLPAPAQGLFEQLDFPDPDNTPAPVFPVPSQRQVEWMKMEFYGFSHYGYNTFLGKEWGNDTKPNARIYAPQSRRHDGRRRRSQAPRRLLHVADGKH